MVTDGEISPPSDSVLNRLDRAREDLGLQVSGGVNLFDSATYISSLACKQGQSSCEWEKSLWISACYAKEGFRWSSMPAQ